MSADHRRPVVAFVVLAFSAAALVGIHRAEAVDARFLASILGSTGQVDGRIPTAGGPDQHGSADLLAVPRGWFAAVEERAVVGQDTSPSAGRGGRATGATRGEVGRKGRPAVRSKGSSRAADEVVPRRVASHPRHALGRRGVAKAVEKAAEKARGKVTPQLRSVDDRDRGRSSRRERRSVGRPAEPAERTAR